MILGYEYLDKVSQQEITRLTRALRKSYTNIYDQDPVPGMTEFHIALAIKRAYYHHKGVRLRTSEKASKLMHLVREAESLWQDHRPPLPIFA